MIDLRTGKIIGVTPSRHTRHAMESNFKLIESFLEEAKEKLDKETINEVREAIDMIRSQYMRGRQA
jgi:hypothetical protein